MLDFLLQLIQTPAIILAIVALIGLVLQKKNASEVFSGTIKTALGMLMLSAGSSIIVQEISPFVDLFQTVFNLDGFATSSEAVVGAMQTAIPVIARTSALIMAVGFIVNVVLARVTPLKYIFLTGHMMWILSVTIAYGFYINDYNESITILAGSILQGMLMVILPAIAQPIVKKITKSDNIAYGHLTTVGVVASAYIGGALGNKNKDAEEVELPKSLSFFKDTSISVSIVMLIFYLFIIISAGPKVVSEMAGEQNYIVYGILKALGFTVGILVLLQGVRLFLGELVPAFKGISDKLVPGARPALDVPALFGFAPNSLMIGFISSVIGMLIAMLVSSIVFKAVPLVSIIGGFFTGGIAGIMGNATGGRRGAVISGFVYGFILIILSAFVYGIFDFGAVGSTGVGQDCIDAMILMILFKQPIIGIGIIIASFILLSILEIKRKKKNNK
ncbi:PTS ascorbate transporter subunit IIC [Miniphocaeibacter halophilus]|uniref:PTS ascorbate transporter subunit IIC n=1 Tax=Miniphocaeibacter halophilus TaxID=2931922 RepID=A0AC61MST4_9FIRM|nr:PTS ascorbate transporter subunit IIC [Miniphocaeibacter halophilus]QQK08637.1 PTS ascorbate transporter subunit IIC [Miniphocaeibacter halophilus]